MKKLLVILAMGAFFASCGSSESTEAKVEEAVKEATTEVVAAADSAIVKIDSAATAIVDSTAAKIDSLKK